MVDDTTLDILSEEPLKKPFVRASAFIEMLLFFGIAIALDTFFFGGHRFSDIAPHPFWIIVLLISAQYGTNEGLLAAILSTAALLWGNIPTQKLNEDIYSWLLQITGQPILWLATATILGEMREHHRRERQELQMRLALSEKRETEITSAYESLAQIKQSLERRVAGQLRTVFSIYNAAKAIEKLDTGEVLMGIGKLVESVLDPEKYSLFLLNQDRLEAALNKGWQTTDPFLREFDDTTTLYKMIVVQRQTLCVTDPIEQTYLGDEGLLAAPLISDEMGEIIGMLKIETMRFRDLTPASLQNFQLICNWIGTAYANARRFEQSVDLARK